MSNPRRQTGYSSVCDVFRNRNINYRRTVTFCLTKTDQKKVIIYRTNESAYLLPMWRLKYEEFRFGILPTTTTKIVAVEPSHSSAAQKNVIMASELHKKWKGRRARALLKNEKSKLVWLQAKWQYFPGISMGRVLIELQNPPKKLLWDWWKASGKRCCCLCSQ